jgi:hypothetical protein
MKGFQVSLVIHSTEARFSKGGLGNPKWRHVPITRKTGGEHSSFGNFKVDGVISDIDTLPNLKKKN